MKHTILYDTTLRDGAQGIGMSFSVEDKLRIVARLDALGIPYIEGGYPGASPKETEFFRRAADLPLQQAKLAAFGTVRKAGQTAENDAGLAALLAAQTSVVCLVAKAWDWQVKEALQTTLEENCAMLADSVTYLKSHGREVIVDLEHCFDGYRAHPAYVHTLIDAACTSGADTIVLCDTNGGTLPHDATEIVESVQHYLTHLADTHCAGQQLPQLGVHFHNDAGCAVANSLLAVNAGVTQVQGTVNGYGERAGNADLLVVAASLVTKRGDSCLTPQQLAQITEVSTFVADVANKSLAEQHPYTGRSAFCHKAGLHVSVLQKLPQAYDHIDPSAVGNADQIVVSDLAGRALLGMKAAALGRELDDAALTAVLARIKQLEQQGYSFEAADASLVLLIDRELDQYRPSFELEAFRVEADKRSAAVTDSEATVKLRVDGQRVVAIGEGNGPVNALDTALRKALQQLYPSLCDIKLLDYKVRVLDESSGTDAVTRVLITSGNSEQTWGTVGVSANIIEASWEALVDSIEYGLSLTETS
ncbi:MAG: citramalate synthase [Coriobacteriia bacterium]|nr:citramalate synthase [Coriobacteriia bacterium]